MKIVDFLIHGVFILLENRRWKYQYKLYRKKYNIATTFKFNGLGIIFYGEGDLSIGSNSYVGSLCSIQVSKDYKCIIGDNCRFASNVKVYTESVYADNDLDINPFDSDKKITKKGNVVIGNGVWLGANVFINPGITIGNNVVVGANSVVTKNLEENGIYGGVPAKLIRKKVSE